MNIIDGVFLGSGFAQADVESRLAKADLRFSAIFDEDVIERSPVLKIDYKDEFEPD